MKLGVVAQNPLEFLALRLGKVPTPVGEGVFAMMLSRTVMAAVRLGLFAALAPTALTVHDLAEKTRCDPAGIEALAEALVSSGYLVHRGPLLANSPTATRWLVPSSPNYLGNLIEFNYDHWNWWSQLEECLQQGTPVDIHHLQQTEEQLRRYVLAMRDLARLSIPELVRSIPLPATARRLLDVGGSHGAYAAALCRRHPGLSATVVDLEPIARICRPLLEEEGLGNRVIYRSADATRDDLGENFDAALLFQLLHHFPSSEAEQLLSRIAGSLKPGGILALLEPARDARRDQLAGLLHLHYFLTSRGGVPEGREITAWLGAAGFLRPRIRRLRSAPGLQLFLSQRLP